MHRTTKIVLLSGLAVLLLDTIGSITSQLLSYPYGCLAPVSFLIYAIAGFLVAKNGSVWISPLAGGIAGLVDATLGWAISDWILGAARLAAGQSAAGALMITVISAVAIGAIAGLIGGVIGMLYRKLKTTTSKPDNP